MDLSVADFYALIQTSRMNHGLRWMGCVVAAVFLSGCAPKESAPAPVAEVEDPAIRREQLFGPEAKFPEITWRSSGLGILMVNPGEGVAPKLMDTVRVHYSGRLKDGTVFDDSRKRNKPSDFVVNHLITGWASAMQTLRPGGHAVFFIPPSLGYGGTRVAGIPPNSGLIFEVELLAVNPE